MGSGKTTCSRVQSPTEYANLFSYVKEQFLNAMGFKKEDTIERETGKERV